jgi:hypothetical protein
VRLRVVLLVMQQETRFAPMTMRGMTVTIFMPLIHQPAMALRECEGQAQALPAMHRLLNATLPV